MFGSIEKLFIELLGACTTGSFVGSLASNSKGHIKHVSLSNWPGQVKPTLVNINFNEPLFYPFTVNVNKYGGSCNTIDNLYVLSVCSK